MRKSKRNLTVVLGMCVIFLLVGSMAAAQDMNKTYDSVDKWIWGKEKQPQQPAPQPTPPPPVQTQQQDQPPPQQTVQEPQVVSSAPTHSKQIGPFVANIKKVVVSRNQISVYMELTNPDKYKTFKIGRDAGIESPSSTDNKGNIFYFSRSNIPYCSVCDSSYTQYDGSYRDSGWKCLSGQLCPKDFEAFGLTLPPQSTNDITLVFGYKELEIKDIGSHFDVSVSFKCYAGGSISKYSISFTDIKAHKPQ